MQRADGAARMGQRQWRAEPRLQPLDQRELLVSRLQSYIHCLLACPSCQSTLPKLANLQALQLQSQVLPPVTATTLGKLVFTVVGLNKSLRMV